MRQSLLLVGLVAISFVAYCWPADTNLNGAKAKQTAKSKQDASAKKDGKSRQETEKKGPVARNDAKSRGIPDVFVLSKPYLSWLIAITMFAIGLMLPMKEVKQVVQRWPSVLAGTAVQYSSMPLLAFLLSLPILFHLNDEYYIGFMLVGCVPGAMASNVLTLNAKGNASYSVSLTTSATILSPIVVPLTLAAVLAGQDRIDNDIFIASSIKLLWIVVLPVVSGFVFGRFLLPKSSERIVNRAGSLIANLVILWIIAVIVALNRNRPMPPVNLVLALLSLNMLGYTVGYCAARQLKLPEGMRRALTLEVGMQNAGLGATLATVLFATSETLQAEVIAVAPAIYTFGCMFTGTVLAAIWAMFPADVEEGAAEKSDP